MVINVQGVIRQHAAALVIQRAGIERQALRLQTLIVTEGVLVNKVQGVEGHAFAAADQPRDVVHRALGAVEQQIAYRLDLPAAVLQIRAVQGGIGLANDAPARAVIQRAGGDVDAVALQQAVLIIQPGSGRERQIRCRRQLPGHVVELVTGKGEAVGG
ncbi:hypothetical protein D3C75_878010 [compost metagenome]